MLVVLEAVLLELLVLLEKILYSQLLLPLVAEVEVDLVLVAQVVQAVADIILQTLVVQEQQVQFKAIMVERVRSMNLAVAVAELVQLVAQVRVTQVALVVMVQQLLFQEVL